MTVKVDKTEWEKLAPDQQQQISAIIGKNFEGQTIAPAEGNDGVAQVGSVCTIACDAAQAAATVACQALPFGQGICIAAAQAAGDYCRGRC